MSKINGDKARYHRRRKANASKRLRWRRLRQPASKKQGAAPDR